MTSHNQLLEDTIKRLEASGRYEHIAWNIEYHDGDRVAGEIDIWATTHDNRWHLYEIKSCPHKYLKARQQLRRFKDNFHPLVDTKYIFVSPSKVKRVYLQ